MGFGRFFAETWIGSKPLFNPSDCMNSSVDGNYVAGYNIPMDSIFPHCPNIRNSIYISPNDSVSANLTGNGDPISWTSQYPETKKGPAAIAIEKEHRKIIQRLRRFYTSNYDLYEPFRAEYGSVCSNASTLVSPEVFYDQINHFFTTKKKKNKANRDQMLQMQVKRALAWYGELPDLLTRWWRLYATPSEYIFPSHSFQCLLSPLALLCSELQLAKADDGTNTLTSILSSKNSLNGMLNGYVRGTTRTRDFEDSSIQ